MSLLAVSSRLAHTASLITQTCGANTKPPGPFTHSLLGNVPIIDIIRDADESERKLVRLEGDDIGRREASITGAGNAKIKKASEKDEPASGVRLGEESVEVLAGAALELVEQYDSMPRAKQHILQLLERSAAIHESIAELQADLATKRPVSSSTGPQTEQASLKDIESSVHDLESTIASVRQKRDAVRARVREFKHATPSRISASGGTKADDEDNPFLANNTLARSMGLPATGSRAAAETSVSSASTAERILRQETPLAVRSANVRRGILGLEEEDGEDETLGEAGVDEDSFDLKEQDEEPGSLLDEMAEPDMDMPDEDGEEMDEVTVILRPSQKPEIGSQPERIVQAAVPPREEENITPSMEIALNKIWSTSAGQVLDASVQEGSSLSPRDTLALLNELLTPPSPPQSPLQPSSVSSFAPNPSNPTPDTVLLAKLLAMLLASPSLMVPLNSLKDQLKKFAAERAFPDPGEKALRGVYGAVGRGLVKIDRARGVVLFA